jgi:hypothetical protein
MIRFVDNRILMPKNGLRPNDFHHEQEARGPIRAKPFLPYGAAKQNASLLV